MRTDKCRDAVARELEKITELSRADLITRWEAVYGRRPPKGISRRLLEYSAAYTVQAKAYGGLKISVRKELDKGLGKRKSEGSVKARSPGKTELSPGARLVRDWHGQTHTVDVVEDGFRYDGRDYKSLSRIAREITGARWSGPRFFGL